MCILWPSLYPSWGILNTHLLRRHRSSQSGNMDQRCWTGKCWYVDESYRTLKYLLCYWQEHVMFQWMYPQMGRLAIPRIFGRVVMRGLLQDVQLLDWEFISSLLQLSLKILEELIRLSQALQGCPGTNVLVIHPSSLCQNVIIPSFYLYWLFK